MAKGAVAARVLVADGSADEREMYALQLSQAGFDVLEASDGLTAREVALAERPDVVIADERLPGLGGLELCRQLKADERTRGVRALLLTSGADVWDDVERARRAGVDAVRLKPCCPETLEADVRRLLARQAASASRRRPVLRVGKGAAPALAARVRTCPRCGRRLRLLAMPSGAGDVLVRCPAGCGRWLVEARGRLRRVS